jgi:hypothetical protein
VSDIDTAVVDSLKALDPEWPIREADIGRGGDRSGLGFDMLVWHTGEAAPLRGSDVSPADKAA